MEVAVLVLGGTQGEAASPSAYYHFSMHAESTCLNQSSGQACHALLQNRTPQRRLPACTIKSG